MWQDNSEWTDGGCYLLSEHTNKSSPIDQTSSCKLFVWISPRPQLNGLLLNAEIVWIHFVINTQNERWDYSHVHTSPHVYTHTQTHTDTHRHTHTSTANSALLCFNCRFCCPWKSTRWAAVNKNSLHVGRGVSLCGLCLPHKSSYLNPKNE